MKTALHTTLTTLTALGLAALTSQADLVTWDNDGGDGLWDTTANWDGNGTGTGGVPGANDTAVIDMALTVVKETAFATPMTINLINASSLQFTAGGVYKNLGAVTINVGAASTLLGSSTYRVNSSTLNFDDGALASSLNMQYRNAGGTLGFNLGATGFTTITAGSLGFEDSGSGSINLSNMTFNIDFASYTGEANSFTLMDWSNDVNDARTSQALLDAATQNFNNASGYDNFALTWDEDNTAIILSFTAAIPEPSALALLLSGGGMLFGLRKWLRRA